MDVEDIVPDFTFAAAGRLRLVLFYIGFWIAFVYAVIATYDAATTNWMTTEAQFVKCRNVFDRTRNGNEEYYYTLDYSFVANGKTYIASYDNAFSSEELAETTRASQIKAASPITIWYKESDPSTTELIYRASEWKMLLMLSIVLLFIIAWMTRVLVRSYKEYIIAKA
jgi:hypothetical protein